MLTDEEKKKIKNPKCFFSKPVHCVVWAKELYAELFAPSNNPTANGGEVEAGDDEFAGDATIIDDALLQADIAKWNSELTNHGKWRWFFFSLRI